MQIFSNPWLIAAAACVLGLIIYAGLLWRRVGLAEQQRQQQRAQQKPQRHADLIILAEGFLSEQMPWAEGCIRIKVILDHYDYELGMQPEYQVLHSIFSATEKIPTHDAWRALSSAEKQPFTHQLSELELQHKQESMRAVQQLLSHLKG